MLTLRLKSGEYVAIGSEIAVQVFRHKGNSFELAVKAPREVPVCRGQLYERKNPRPEGLRESPDGAPGAKSRGRRAEAARQIEKILSRWVESHPDLEEEAARLREEVSRLKGEEEG